MLTAAAGALLLALGASSTTWRAWRGARLAEAAARTQLAAERALADGASQLLADSLPQRPLFDTVRRSHVDAQGIRIAQWAVRTAPQVVWLAVEARSADPAGAAATRAAIGRPLFLRPPAWPLRAAFTGASAVDTVAARVRGSDGPDLSACRPWRAAAVPATHVMSSDSMRGALDPDWRRLVAGAPGYTGDAPADGRWGAATIVAADSVLTGPRQWRGMLLHDGPLRLVGRISLTGVLVVRGAFDASAAQLNVRGALLVAGDTGAVVTLGAASIEWNRCAVDMAMATLAEARAGPFFTWTTVTP